ncbi:MAG TPA: hypothetical protein PLS63_04435 [Microthrixaceae bacterium]|jgi:hypothetical protein|nr:hypothetical protein [Microthrixaceae bacterium]
MKQAEHYPPTSNPEARYDAVVARGRSLERSARRRRTLVSTGVAALVVVVVGAAVFGALNTGDTSQGPAGPATTGAPTTQPGPTTATTPLRVSATTVDGAVTVQLDRSAAPVPAGTRVCVHVRMQPAGRAQVATAESTACWNPADGDAVTEVELTRTLGAAVGCAASTGDASVGTDGAPVTLERGDGTDPGSATTAPQTSSTDPTVSAAPTALQHSFRFRLPTGLPAGSYVAEATGVVGTGDGCPTSTPGDDEEVATATAAVTVP